MIRFLLIAALVLGVAAPAGKVLAQGVYPDIPAKDIPKAPVIAPGTQLKPGDIFRDCETCPEMVVVPPGLFVMGSKLHKSEMPTRVVRFRKPFAIGRFETLHANWQACLDAGGCTHKPDDHKWGTERKPVINISHDMVHGYADWLTKTTGKKYRLPSEAEWEYAAKAGTKSNYWFGDQVGENQVNCRKCGSPWSGIGNAPVGSFAPNPWGLYDMNGNAFEWVEDCWHETYDGAPKGPEAWVGGKCQFRVIRGGSWYYYSRMSRAANRQKNPGAVKSYWLSFRLVRELP
ncbi:MAG: formylglycine-generating enzyme family protein [Rhodospirillales bacterium]